MKTVKVFAPAKVNLTLHVTGQRTDGYHRLDSLVAFAPVGDWITITEGDGLTLSVDGPEAEGVPEGADNLVLRAAQILARGRGAAITLEKHLPVASGLGGGSADAAAVLRGLMTFWQLDDIAQGDDSVLEPFARDILALGADIPMCLISHPARVRGIGERVDLFGPLGPIPALLINPRISVPTPSVFKALKQRDNAPMQDQLPEFQGIDDFTDWAADQRNDLESPTRAMAPEIGLVLGALSLTPECLLARMSGSGATCFGLYPDRQAVEQAAHEIRALHPDWWVAGGFLGDQSALAIPMVAD